MKNTVIILACLCVFSISSYAQTLTWQEIVEYSKNNNPSIKKASLELNNSEFAYKSTYSGFMPSIDLKGSAGQSSREDVFSRSYSYGASGKLSLFSGFFDYSNIKSASLALEAERSSYQRTVSDVAYQIAKQYINLIWAYESVKLSEKIFKRRKENYDMVLLKYNSGNVDKGSLMRVEADTELAIYELNKAKRYVETASAALLNAMGQAAGEVVNTPATLTMLDRYLDKPEFAVFIKTIPEYKIAMFNLQKSKEELVKSKSSLYPDISLSGNISRFDNEWAPNKDAWDGGLSITMPLFTGGTRIFDIKTSSNKVKMADEDLKNTTYLLLSRVIELYNQILDANDNLVLREKYLTAAEVQALISAKKYVNGLSTYQDWYSIENDYINSQKTLLNTKREAALARIEWQNFIGLDFIEPGK